MTHRLLFAGFGGQGIMLMGELLAYAAMIDGKQVTYMPSYGPEMRGGTANCSVIVSDGPIASPIITEAGILIAMNEPSLDKFEDDVDPEGLVFINRSLIGRKPRRSDVVSVAVDCIELARDILNEKIANIVMLGAVIRKSNIVSPDSVGEALRRKFSGKKEAFIPINESALSAWRERSEEH
ncbi:MAG: 2-oxoacid:acceptor oxidoreductase family protein [Clostridiales Family XIII bacterium]|jgi:2-oxoglutarate ferredoxin oxidoreductase subunit gamma|nr:2-oxoacid:acceptor oxidoreductase family protein [Clostridiales Family XIII bacterium]